MADEQHRDSDDPQSHYETDGAPTERGGQPKVGTDPQDLPQEDGHKKIVSPNPKKVRDHDAEPAPNDEEDRAERIKNA